MMTSRRLTVQQRKEIFLELVTVQDTKMMSVGDSYRHVAERYAVSEDQVREIAEEGGDKEWPPLGEDKDEE